MRVLPQIGKQGARPGRLTHLHTDPWPNFDVLQQCTAQGKLTRSELIGRQAHEESVAVWCVRKLHRSRRRWRWLPSILAKTTVTLPACWSGARGDLFVLGCDERARTGREVHDFLAPSSIGFEFHFSTNALLDPFLQVDIRRKKSRRVAPYASISGEVCEGGQLSRFPTSKELKDCIAQSVLLWAKRVGIKTGKESLAIRSRIGRNGRHRPPASSPRRRRLRGAAQEQLILAGFVAPHLDLSPDPSVDPLCQGEGLGPPRLHKVYERLPQRCFMWGQPRGREVGEESLNLCDRALPCHDGSPGSALRNPSLPTPT
mmetsp:Transcript_9227/g.21627  ORF Transcript_9227/g.21627 Transcript_9227/m.21627 type:complete len:315 (-) Transcript_9227:3-947(-)